MGNTNVNKIMLSAIEKQRYDKIVEIIEVLNVLIRNIHKYCRKI